MFRFLPNIFIDYSSFWLGALLAGTLLFLFLRYRSRITAFISRLLKKILQFREQLSVASENDYANIIHRYVQGLHLLADLYPLKSILVPPRCIAPLPDLIPGEEILDPSLIQQTLGYDPYLADLAYEYHAPTFTLAEAISKDANICLVGFPGSGKTTAIADCISQMVTLNSSEPDNSPRIPFYTTAHHILAQFPGSDLLVIILAAIQSNPLFNSIPGFPKFLTAAINSGQATLFIDDLDLLSYSDTNRLSNFLSALIKTIPGLQLVITATPTCLGGLPKTPFSLVSIASWDNQSKYSFLKKTGKLWPSSEDTPGVLTSEISGIKHSMLVVSDHFSSPLEFTLKAWSAAAGDIRSSASTSALETYLERCFSTNTATSLRTLETISLHALEQEKSSFTRKDISAWFAEINTNADAPLADDKISLLTPVLQTAFDFGILKRDGAEGFYIASATVGGFLAARALSRVANSVAVKILRQPGWSLKYEMMRYLAAFCDPAPYLGLAQADQSAMKDLLIQSTSWLGFLKPGSAEEIALLKSLTREIHTNPAYPLKLRLVIGLAKSGNKNTASVFQHLQKTRDLDTRRAAVLGSGLIRDLASVPLLITLLNDDFPVSAAACYALGMIGSPRSLEAIAECLLHGNEILRRSAAESLAHNRSEGHPALREGASMSDLLVRYAVVHGLGMIPEPWALDMLAKMRIDEDEWVVRDLAHQVYEIHENGSPYIPKKRPPDTIASWLKKYAAKRNLPQLVPETVLEVLLMALEEGSDEEKLASLAYLVSDGENKIYSELIKHYGDPNPAIRQQSLLTAWYGLPPGYTPSA